MNLSELKSLLHDHADRHFRIQLPDGKSVPVSFHVTEVGRLEKTFIDCGGKLRDKTTCQLQIWVGDDYDHRIETGKMAAILDKAASILPDGSVPVEIEYEDRVISQYTIADHTLSDDAVILKLENKHTECLAPELCGLPSFRLPGIGGKTPCCGPGGC
ncbi:MAG: hypothetical protein HC845_01590 [Akkermansiaceae bacterium]|nr:hypothetical protein [Akkermansiaceae bacterium]